MSKLPITDQRAFDTVGCVKVISLIKFVGHIVGEWLGFYQQLKVWYIFEWSLTPMQVQNTSRPYSFSCCYKEDIHEGWTVTGRWWQSQSSQWSCSWIHMAWDLHTLNPVSNPGRLCLWATSFQRKLPYASRWWCVVTWMPTYWIAVSLNPSSYAFELRRE